MNNLRQKTGFFFNRYGEAIFLFFLLVITFFSAAYKLTESPPTWYDEGFIIQSAENLVANGKMGIQIAPGEFVEKGVIFSTGYPVAYPVGLVMRFFGDGLLSARSVMVVFLILLVVFSYFLARRMWGVKIAVISSLLLISFASLYGNGKNVLGEVPGLFFAILFLFFLNKIEKEDYKSSISNYIMAGLAIGLCISTKSIFLVLPPALILGLIIFRKRVYWNWRHIFGGLAAFSLTIILLIITQFSKTDSLYKILQDYSNPYAVANMSSLVIKNIARFFTEATPIYFLVLLVVWTIAIFLKIRYKKEKITLTESVSYLFVLLIWLAYFRIVGWYRYFFPAQVVLLLFFPTSFLTVFEWFKNKFAWSRAIGVKIPMVLLLILAGLQFYQFCFHSWVASYYSGHKTLDLKNYFSRLDPSTKVFIYNASEIVTFLPSNNYYQYLKITDTLILGQEQLEKIKAGTPDIIIINNEEARTTISFSLYQEKAAVSRYLILEKVKN